jgi:hypothetical protein
MGRVDIFLSESLRASASDISLNSADLTLKGNHIYDRFGASLVIDTSVKPNILVVGSPGAHCSFCDHYSPSGKITGFEIEKSATGSLTAKKVFSVEGTGAKGKFGSAMAIGRPFGGEGSSPFFILFLKNQMFTPHPISSHFI